MSKNGFFFIIFFAFFLEFSNGKNDDLRLLQSYQPLNTYKFGDKSMIGVLPSGIGFASCLYSPSDSTIYITIFPQTSISYSMTEPNIYSASFSEITNYGFMVSFICQNIPYLFVFDN